MKLCVIAEDSRKINDQEGPCFVMAGAGMRNAGCTLHHLKASLRKPPPHLLILGCQGDGFLGQRLINGEKQTVIHGDKAAVIARIHALGGFSAHAGQNDLLTSFSAIAPGKPQVVLPHGKDGPRAALAQKIKEQFKLTSQRPALGETIVI